MNLKEIDRALAAWDERLAAVARNLLELQQEPAYRLLTGSGGSPQVTLSGVTASRVQPSLKTLAMLFEQFGLLNETIARARELRQGLPALFGTEQKVTEIAHLLSDRTICLKTADLASEERRLFEGSQHQERLSPAELLERMSRVFTAARNAVLAVDAAWLRVAQEIDAGQAEVQRLRPCAGTRDEADLRGVELDLAKVTDTLKTDPLGAVESLNDRVRPALARVAARQALQEQVQKELQVARQEKRELDRLHGETLAAAAEARLKIRDLVPQDGIVADEQLLGLSEWLQRMEDRVQQTAPEAVQVALGNWRAALAVLLAQDRAALAAYRAPLEMRAELRGRMQALKAKARAYGVAEQDSLVPLASHADELLRERPIALDEALAAVSAYEGSLRETDRLRLKRAGQKG